jgi:PAS domain S-box-containing protein
MRYKSNDQALAKRVRELEQKLSEFKKIETSLKDSQTLLHTTIENLPFDFFAIDENNRYFLQNSVCMERWGNLIGLQPKDVKIEQEVIDVWLDNNRRAFSGETVRDEVEYVRDGQKGFYYNIISPIKDGQRVIGILGINLDITERKRAEDALEKLNKELEKRVEKRTAELVSTNLQLQKEIHQRNQVEIELRAKTRELEELNAALKVLLRKRDEDKKEIEEKIASNVNELIFPYIERLKITNLGNRQRSFIKILETNLDDIISPFARNL